MATHPDDRAPPPHWSLAGFALGLRLALPVIPGMMAFGLAVGTTTARKGFSFADDVLMNLLVYAGMSQLVVIENWPEHIDAAALAGLAIVCATVNARMMLMSAALQPWLGPLPAWQMYPALHLLTDPSWLISMRYRGEGGSDAGVFLGSSAILAVVWISAAAAGHLAGSLISDPRRFGIDLVMPVFFAAMLVPLWRGPRRALAWLIAGAVAIAVQRLVGGWWFIVAGALAGSIAGGYLNDPE